MAIYVRKRIHNPSTMLVVNFVLGAAIGAAIGLSCGYALWGGGKAVDDVAPAEVADRFQPTAEADDSAPLEAQPDAEAAPAPDTAAEPLAPPEPAPAEVWPGRLLWIAVTGTELDDATAALLGEVRPGGVVLGDGNLADAAQTAQLVAQIKQAAGMGTGASDLPLIGVDHEGGSMNSLRVAYAPSAAELGLSKDTDAARRAGRACASAAVSQGIGVILAPVLDVYAPDVAETDLGPRLFGSDQELVAVMGLAFADGVMDGGAIPVGKYYPGIGAPRPGLGEGLMVLEAELPRLAELMYPFSEAAGQGIPGILVGGVAVPTLDGQIPTRPASLSPVLVGRVLREHWQYGGVVLADDVALNPATQAVPDEGAVVQALEAGCDAVLFLDPDHARIRAACHAIQNALDEAKLTHEQLAQSATRLEAWRLRLAETPVPPPAPEPPEAKPPEEEAKPPEQEPEPEVAQPKPEAPEAKPAEEQAKPVPEAPEPKPAEEQAKPGVPEPKPAEEQAKPTPEAPEPKPAPEAPEPAEEEAQPKPEAPEPKPAPEKAEPKPAEEQAKPKPEAAEPKPPEPKPAEEEPKPELKPPEEEPKPPEEEAKPASAKQPPDTRKILHEVERGDTLSEIAAKYQVKQSDIRAWNGMTDSTVKLGLKLVIYKPITEEAEATAPVVTETDRYTVVEGDTAHRIAARYGITAKQLAELNGLEDPSMIFVGQRLKVPNRP